MIISNINMNDTMTFKVNSPVKIQSSYSFPIYNKAGETVAYAEVSPESGAVTVTFWSLLQRPQIKQKHRIKS